MSLMLNRSILRRLDGSETLTGDQLAAQALTSAIPWHSGPLDNNVVMPCGTFIEDAGTESLGGVDVGIVQNSVYRFLVYREERGGAYIPQLADALEVLFDQRRGAPVLDIPGYSRCFWSDLFVPLQQPLHDDHINAFFGIIAFRFVEARP